MNVLDENIREDQRNVLRRWRIPFRQIGKEISHTGIQDADIIPLLHRLPKPTFFTQDEDFLKRKLCHPAYAIFHLDISASEAAVAIRRVLRHPLFSTWQRRSAIVATVQPVAISYWRLGDSLTHCVSTPRRL